MRAARLYPNEQVSLPKMDGKDRRRLHSSRNGSTETPSFVSLEISRGLVHPASLFASPGMSFYRMDNLDRKFLALDVKLHLIDAEQKQIEGRRRSCSRIHPAIGGVDDKFFIIPALSDEI
jgi:hypothetical protein